MPSLAEITQLCRLCLVKDQVNIPIFNGQGDIQQIFHKISTCLPVKISQEDGLPKNICDGCSHKLDMFYQFWNTSSNSEKQLLQWLKEIERSLSLEKDASVQQSHSICPDDDVVLKQEAIDIDEHNADDGIPTDDLNVPTDPDYLLQQSYGSFDYQQEAYNEEAATSNAAGPSSTVTSETAAVAAPKRKRRAAAMKPLPPQINSEDEDDPDAVETKIAKTEKLSDDEDESNPEPTTFVGLPTDNEQPGPSGVDKVTGEAPSDVDDKSIVKWLIFDSPISIKHEPKSPPSEDPDSHISSHHVLYGVEDSLNLLQMQGPRKKRSKQRKTVTEENHQKDTKRTYTRKENGGKSNARHKKLVKKEDYSELNEVKFEPLDQVTNYHKDMRNTLIGIDKSNIIKGVRRTDILASKRRAAAIEKRRRDWEAKNMSELLKKEAYKKKSYQKVEACCNICKKTFSKDLSLALHSVKHSKEKKYSCHLCPYITVSKPLVVKHIRAHGDKTKYKCEICNWAFTGTTEAAEHKYFHTGEKPFQCELCGKHFMFSRVLDSHRRTRHWEEITGLPLVKYDCTICNLHYTSHSGLKRHQLRYHRQTEKPFNSSVKCNMCGKMLSSKDKLRLHIRTHTGYKPHECVICSKRFIRKEQLKEHERVHTGERPFTCQHCGKGFTQRSPLKIHVRLHTGEKPYVCDLCNKGFISKSMRDTHLKRCEEKCAKTD